MHWCKFHLKRVPLVPLKFHFKNIKINTTPATVHARTSITSRTLMRNYRTQIPVNSHNAIAELFFKRWQAAARRGGKLSEVNRRSNAAPPSSTLLSRSYSSDSSFILKNSRAPGLSPIKNHGVIYLRLGYNRAWTRQAKGGPGVGVNNGQAARKGRTLRKRGRTAKRN